VRPDRKAYIFFQGKQFGGIVVKNILLAVIAAAAIAGGVLYFAEKRSQPASIEAGIPEYPGAAADADSFSMSLPAAESAKLIKAVIYRTDDPPEKVIAFYKEKLAGKTQVIEQNRNGKAFAIFRAEVNGKSIVIMIGFNEDAKKTEIVMGTLASPPAE
jgi:hypothetical protein